VDIPIARRIVTAVGVAGVLGGAVIVWGTADPLHRYFVVAAAVTLALGVALARWHDLR
jgi:hypothetical protein